MENGMEDKTPNWSEYVATKNYDDKSNSDDKTYDNSDDKKYNNSNDE